MYDTFTFDFEEGFVGNFKIYKKGIYLEPPYLPRDHK